MLSVQVLACLWCSEHPIKVALIAPFFMDLLQGLAPVLSRLKDVVSIWVVHRSIAVLLIGFVFEGLVGRNEAVLVSV